MAEATIPVDLFNPGQVFACLGLLEASDVLFGGAVGAFDAASFTLRAEIEGDPVRAVLEFLGGAEVASEAPAGSELDTAKWSVPTRSLPADAPFPFALPASPATLPAILVDGERVLRVEYWGDGERDNFKLWAGAGGYPGVSLLRDALELLRGKLPDVHRDPFSVALPQSSSFRFDWRRDYVPLGVGFSLNNHGDMQPLGYPLVEVLAALGVQHARPKRVRPSDKLSYRYAVVTGAFLRPALHRAVLGAAPLPFPTRVFRITLGWPGKEGQARCITDVVEEI